MRRAEWIANRLLEAVPPRTPAAPRGSVYVLSGGSGKDYPSMDAFVTASLGGKETPPGMKPEELVRRVVDGAINRGSVIVSQPDYGKLTVYAKDVPVPVSTEQVRYMQHRFNVLYPNKIGFARSIGIRPMPVPFDNIFAAQKVMDQQGRTKEKLAKQAEKADKDLAKEQEKQPEQLRRGIDTERGSWFNPKGWREDFKREYGRYPDEIETGYTEGTPEPEQQNPFSLGIDFDRRYRGRGVLVANVLPDGPAAASVLRAGDIIRAVGPFETRSGVVAGPYRITKPAELQRTLSWLRGGTAFPMKVVRGSGYVDVVIMPQLSKSNA